MKKSQVYIIVPLVALVCFVAYYLSFSREYDRKQMEKAAAIQKDKDDKLQEQNRMRLRAVQEALAQQERRKADKAAKDAAEQKKREDRQLAYQNRDKAQIGISKWRERYERLSKDVSDTKEQIAKINRDKDTLVEQKVFLNKLAEQTEVNVKSLTVVLEKIQKADDAMAAYNTALAKLQKK